MAVGSDPTPARTRTTDPETVTPRPNKWGKENEGHRRSADLSSYSPPLLTAFASGGASPQAEWEDDLPGAESEDDVASADSEDEAEWAAAAAAAAAELEEEAKWEDAAPAESEEDVPAAESEDDAGGDANTGEPDSPPRGWPSNSARRDPCKAELFRRLDAACEARRLQENRLLKRPSPPARSGDPDEPIWPPKSPYWRRFRELRAMKSSPSDPVLNPDENSNKNNEMLSEKVVDQRDDTKHSSKSASPYENDPPSNKSNEMLSEKVVDQRDDTKHSSKSASPYENDHGKKTLPAPSKRIRYSINTYAVQCGKCRKWRLVPTKMEYEELRDKSREILFTCGHVHGWKPGVSCDDPADISQDDGFWVIDKPCLSQTPLGWERTISLRSEGCTQFADVYYIPPKGKKLRSTEEAKTYLQANPDYAAGLQPSRDWFAVPARGKENRRQLKPLESKEGILCTTLTHLLYWHDK
uniref:Uncharacterized protein n=1 Tax=Avena sativa TaxID=4498 RepID=A0ACD5ZT23_AVESA